MKYLFHITVFACAVFGLTSCEGGQTANGTSSPNPVPVVEVPRNSPSNLETEALQIAANGSAIQGPRCADFQQFKDRLNIPGMTIFVTSSDTVILHCVYGVRKLGNDSAIGHNDLWHIGSNTKAMTASLIARLQQEGQLAWSDTTHDVFEDMKSRNNFKSMSYVDFLTHTSGLLPSTQMYGLVAMSGTDAERDSREDRYNFTLRALATEPADTKFAYANSGYIVAGAMIEHQTGQRWEALMAEHVFKPLEITRFGFGPPGSDKSLDHPVGHRVQSPSSRPIAAEAPSNDNPPVFGPAGRVHISMPDYGRYLRVHLKALRNTPQDFLTPENAERVFSPGKDNYGMGWGIKDNTAFHSGSNTMWLTVTVIDASKDRAVIIAGNGAHMESYYPVFKDAAKAAINLDHEVSGKR